ncbi:MAG: kelch repeat-containing protein, partial [Anaerolineales bacterium]
MSEYRLLLCIIILASTAAGCRAFGPSSTAETTPSLVAEPSTPVEQPTVMPTATLNPLDLPSGEWVSLARMQMSRSEYTAEAIDGQIYVPGGLAGGASLNPSNALERYDPLSNTWVYLAILPAMRHHAATAVWHERL